MPAKLVCRYCGWESEAWDTDINTVVPAAKNHIKTSHKAAWNYWAFKGKVLQECFKTAELRKKNETTPESY